MGIAQVMYRFDILSYIFTAIKFTYNIYIYHRSSYYIYTQYNKPTEMFG